MTQRVNPYGAQLWPNLMVRPGKGTLENNTLVPDRSYWNLWRSPSTESTYIPVSAEKGSILDILRQQPDCSKFTTIITGTPLEKPLGNSLRAGIQRTYTVVAPVDSTEGYDRYLDTATTSCYNAFEMLQKHVSHSLITPEMIRKYRKLDIPTVWTETQLPISFEWYKNGIIVGKNKYRVSEVIPTTNGYIFKTNGILEHVPIRHPCIGRTDCQDYTSATPYNVVPRVLPRINYL